MPTPTPATPATFRSMIKSAWFYVCLLAAILIGTFGTMVFRSDEVSTSEIQAMSLEEYEALVKRRDQLNVTIDRFKSTWTDKLRSIDDATANR